ncbi:5-oxoprolinase subunit PxpB [Psychromonas antarctica]|uniref:5-oxoprolinase subunit PxpB n=1 Tax=Psychromonas antarctica TaxID=67573 RepID=UPI001EE8D00A|nr:5-oxoprolinase subunit PxpB [Psychromonas antarctica]MCG6201281.1 5-oxoprolinase subunit PxpB [Psychromonas antarctica]
MKILALNEDCFLIQVSDTIDLALTDKIAFLVKQIEMQLGDALVDITPSYSTILVHYNLLKIAPLVVENLLETAVLSTSLNSVFKGQNKVIELPVYYNVSVGWDLPALSEQTGLSIEQIIQLHSDTKYRVCAVGFAPGFAFLAQVPAAINIARHASPRAVVPAGSVAIADAQTAVYPADSPGGWQIIGNCPVKLFDLNNDPITPFAIGDSVKFRSILLDEFLRLGGQIIDEK